MGTSPPLSLLRTRTSLTTVLEEIVAFALKEARHRVELDSKTLVADGGEWVLKCQSCRRESLESEAEESGCPRVTNKDYFTDHDWRPVVADGGRSILDYDHRYINRLREISWETERYHTVVYQCEDPECQSRKWSREEKPGALSNLRRTEVRRPTHSRSAERSSPKTISR